MILIRTRAFAIVFSVDIKRATKMTFQEYWAAATPQQKKDLAEFFETSVQYLSQIAHGIRQPGVKFVMGVDEATSGHVTQKELVDGCQRVRDINQVVRSGQAAA